MLKNQTNLEAEQVVIAGICKGIYLLENISFDDFYDPKHRKLFNLILGIKDQIPKIDSVVLYNEVEKKDLNNEVGGELNVIDIVDGKQIEAKCNTEYWFKEFKEISNKRKSLVFANQLSYDIETNDISLKEIKSKITKFRQELNSGSNIKDKFKIKNLKDFMGKEQPLIHWIVEDLIIEGAVILLVAKPKVGKSILAVNIALAVAQGHNILGKKTSKSRTLYIALEDRERLVQSRLWNMLGKPGEIGFDIYCGDVLINEKKYREQLKEQINENNYRLVVIDPLIEAYRGADENNPNQMVEVLSLFREIAHETNTSVVVVHHTRKSQGEGGDVIRGSSAIWGAVDGAIMLKPLNSSDGIIKVSIETTLRDAESGEKAVISLNDSLNWELVGTFEEFNVKSTTEKILEYLEEGEASIIEISKGIEIDYETVKKSLQRLIEKKQVERRSLGNNRNSGHKYFLSLEMSQDIVPKNNVFDIEDLPNLFDTHGTS